MICRDDDFIMQAACLLFLPISHAEASRYRNKVVAFLKQCTKSASVIISTERDVNFCTASIVLMLSLHAFLHDKISKAQPEYSRLFYIRGFPPISAKCYLMHMSRWRILCHIFGAIRNAMKDDFQWIRSAEVNMNQNHRAQRVEVDSTGYRESLSPPLTPPFQIMTDEACHWWLISAT